MNNTTWSQLCGHLLRPAILIAVIVMTTTFSTAGTMSSESKQPDFYIASADYQSLDEPLACYLVAKFHHNKNDYWLVQIKPDYGTLAADGQPIGNFGERAPTAFFVIAPRIVGVGFDKIGARPVEVHVFVPRANKYPPSETRFDLADYVHLVWGTIYPTYALAKTKAIRF